MLTRENAPLAPPIPPVYFAKCSKADMLTLRASVVTRTRYVFPAARLARKADEVAVADIILAVDEPIDATQCGGKENCLDEQKCLTHDLWTNLNSHIFDYLRGVKLADLVKQNQERLRQAGVAELQDRRPKRRPETVTV